MSENMLLKAILQFDGRQAIASIGQTSLSFARLQGNMKTVGAGMGKLGGSMGMLTLGLTPLTLGLGVAVHSAEEFQSAIVSIQTIADKTQFPVEKLEKASIGLGLAFGSSPTEQARSMYDAISAGATTSGEALAIMDSSNRLAIAGQAELGPTLKLMGKIMNTYGKSGLEAGEAIDVLFNSTKYGVQTIPEMASAMGGIVPTANKLGLDFRELNGALVTATLQGDTFSEAATGINMALTNVMKPSKQAREAAEELGISFDSAHLKNKGLVKFFDEIAKKVGDDESKMVALFGSIRGFQSVVKLTARDGAAYNEVMQKMVGPDVAGSAERAFKQMTETMGFQLKKLNSLRQTTQIVFGQAMEKPLGKILSIFSGLGDSILEILWMVKTGDFTGSTPLMAAVAKGISKALDDINKGVDWLKVKFEEFSGWMGDAFGGDTIQKVSEIATLVLVIGAAITPVLAIVGGLAFMAPMIIGMITGLGTLIGGIFGIITGPVGLALAVFYIFRDEITGMFDGASQVGKFFISDVLDAITGAMTEIIVFISKIGDQWSAVTGGMQADWVEVGRVVGSVLSGVILVAVQSILAVITSIVEFIGTIVYGIGMIGTALGEIAGKIYVFFTNPLGTAARILAGIMGSVGMKVSPELRAAATAATPAAMTEGATVVRTMAAGQREEKKKKADGETKQRNFAEEMMREIQADIKASREAVEASREEVKKNKKTSVNIDGREVARANAKHEREIEIRSGSSATPWQRRQLVVNGARAL